MSKEDALETEERNVMVERTSSTSRILEELEESGWNKEDECVDLMLRDAADGLQGVSRVSFEDIHLIWTLVLDGSGQSKPAVYD
ncbi:unnamed protein product [Bursaphelenchus okinawaensis]|uniref:Uncharacterized protein n=1 Tax=Bursaphelenchus okinawaensis TaxID=465554 RepID=A0A811JQN1_9BILA|nr:unnamed protein product [Bursaphelenchus okinawaensis]CAG9078730.1 unnamed protein product [Bursaphelenchus okinawaensis]